MEKKRVACFMLFYANKEDLVTESRMSFFTILDDDKIVKESVSSSIIQPLLPFTGLKGFPYACTVASVENRVYVIGGSTLPAHLQFRTEEIVVERLNRTCRKYLKRHSLGDLRDRRSKRVLCLDAEKCLDSLSQNNQMEKTEFVEFDEVSKDSLSCWGKRPSLSTGRRDCHILHLGGKLYAIGGNDDGNKPTSTSLIEVCDHHGVWTPLKLDHSERIDPSGFVSVAIEKENAILIGSNESFFKIDVGKGSVQEWKEVECPKDLVGGCFPEPGFVIHERYALWYDGLLSYIRLLDLDTNTHHTVHLPENIYRLLLQIPDSCASLIGLGEGLCCLIFIGTDLILEHGVEYTLRDYHYVKFEIIFYREYGGREGKRPRKSFPGVRSKLISHVKFYAPEDQMLGAAFAIDVHVPQKKNLFHTSYFEVEDLKYRSRTCRC